MTRKLFLIISLILLLVIGAYINSLSSRLEARLSKEFKEYTVDRKITEAEKTIGKIVVDCSDDNDPDFFLAQTLASEYIDKNGSYVRFQIERLAFSRLLSFAYTDEQILGMWLSNVYLGKRDYGISAAAGSIYSKSVDSLSDEEAIAIASLIKAPNRFRNNPDAWNERIQVLRTCYANL